MKHHRICISILVCLVALIGGCATGPKEVPDQSPCTGYIKASTQPCLVVPINPTTT